jgi:hypothetical protein
MNLTLERKSQIDESPLVAANGQVIASITPRVGDDDYWAYRVGLTESQALLGFPKFGVVGIGFAVEDEDWNTNLPSSIDAEKILDHIWKNAGPTVTDKAVVLEAIQLIQRAVEEDRRG